MNWNLISSVMGSDFEFFQVILILQRMILITLLQLVILIFMIMWPILPVLGYMTISSICNTIVLLLS